ncbi:MAG TPA: zinc ribbon domain-containing protein [Ignavibacteria bacterium]|nr:zinc ribbon domain-containing protein [Ignavibacteria bacterium]
MKCSNCNTQNKSDSKVCINCGHKFETADNNVETIKVKNIQSENDEYQAHKKYVKGKNFDILTELRNHKIFTAVAIIITGYFFYQALPKDHEYFNLVASKFVCSCGACGELSLENCVCLTATKEHKYINNLLSQNNTISQAIVAVANKYGWLKSQYYPQYQVDKSKVWFGGISRQ